MSEIELDFEDDSLGETLDVGSEIVDPIVEPVEPEVVKPKPGRPKKNEPKSDVIKEEEIVEVVDDEPEAEPETDSDVEEGFIKSIASKWGIDLPEGVEFEDTEDGLAEFNEYVADLKADTKLNGWLEDLGPEAGNYFDYLQMIKDDPDRGEKIRKYFSTVNPEIDYKSVDLTNEDTQKAVMKTFYKKMDYTDEEIKDAIDDLEIANTLEKQAKVASVKLAAIQEKENEKLIAQEREEAAIKKQNIQKFFGNVKNVIENGKVNNFTIPATEKRSQFEYDSSGQFMKDLNEILQDPTKRTELGIAIKNKFNLNKYITTAAATQKAASLKDKLKGGTSKLKGGASGSSVVNSGIDWDNA